MIKVKNLTKKYGNNTAVKDLCFEIKEGGICGFLGPNGAGKSTTMNIITGCLCANEGTVSVGGYDIVDQPVKAKKLIGYLPENPPLYNDMTVAEYLTFVAEAKGVAKNRIAEDVKKVMDATSVTNVADRLTANLSKGYRQRVGIAQAMLGDPEVIILDEPTVGLDPKQIIEIRELICELGREHTVILSSHILSEVQAVCDRAIIITGGKVVANDTMENLNSLGYEHPVVQIIAKTTPEVAMDIIDEFDEISHFAITEEGDATKLELTLAYPVDIREKLYFAFANAEIGLLELCEKKRSLEEIYLTLTEIVSEEEEEEVVEKEEEEKNDNDSSDYTSMFGGGEE